MKNEECDKKEKNSEAIAQQIQKKFIDERKIFFFGEVNDESCAEAVKKLLYLDMMDKKAEITIYLSTPGGSINAGMALYDTIKLISAPVKIVVTGIAMSMGSILLSAAKKGKRFLFPNASVMIHQPLIMGEFSGTAVDIHIQAREMERMRDILNKILSDASGQPLEKIRKDTDRDFFMTAKEAVEYGLADGIVDSL
ncbi:MAG: ATP-dependent Clp protease proteolytic subunit [Opitutales bacterium]|nr:ATP-dependent Clp protease proteolytic subunit [Opitutales bacterium]